MLYAYNSLKLSSVGDLPSFLWPLQNQPVQNTPHRLSVCQPEPVLSLSPDPISFLSEQNHRLPAAQLRNLRGISFSLSALPVNVQHVIRPSLLVFLCMFICEGHLELKRNPFHPWFKKRGQFSVPFLASWFSQADSNFLLLPQWSSYNANLIASFL